MGRIMLVCGAAVLALAACSKKDGAAAGGGQAAAPAADGAAKTASAAAPASSEPPTRKAGLWEQTMAFNGMKQTLSMCIDEATEQKARWWRTEGRRGGRASVECSEESFNRTLTGGWKIHSVCREPNGMTITSDGSATGNFGDSYHVEMTSVTTGSSMPEANGTHHMVMDGAWKGPCPAGMKGGDMVLPGGMKMNALNPGAGPTGANGGPPSQAEIAKMRAQAMEMAKKYKEGAQ